MERSALLTLSNLFLLGAQAGVTGNGEIRFMKICRRTTVRALPEALRHRRNQRILLLMADGCGRPGLAAPARQEEVRLHRQGCELITHIKKFKGTKTLVKDFGMIADVKLPPSYRYTKTRLGDIVSQLDPARRNVIPARQLVE
jgi:hypothetical protein